MESQDVHLVNSLIEGCKPYSAVAILKSLLEISEPGVIYLIDSVCHGNSGIDRTIAQRFRRWFDFDT